MKFYLCKNLENACENFETEFCKKFCSYVCHWKGNIIGNNSTQIFEIENPLENTILCKLSIRDESLEKDGGLDCLEKINIEFDNIKSRKYTKLCYGFGRLTCY